MNRTLWVAIALVSVTAASCAGLNQTVRQDTPDSTETGYQQPGVEVGMFAELGQYGSWFDLTGYGWVWRPDVAVGWQPYDNGQWVWTEYGWTWVSYEPFGWATCHYGYWDDDTGLGWVWIPGYQWYPSRVEWSEFGDYVCWAPLGPPGVNLGEPWAPSPANAWFVIHAAHFTDRDVARYRVEREEFMPDFQGDARREPPRVRTIERYKGHSVPEVALQFERHELNGHEFRRMQLPPRQARIVQSHRVQVMHVTRHSAHVAHAKRHPAHVAVHHQHVAVHQRAARHHASAGGSSWSHLVSRLHHGSKSRGGSHSGHR